MITEFAAAKVNLALHVTGRREDGYHLLETLVVFCDVGDIVTVGRPGPGRDEFALSGPHGGELDDGGNNLVLRARNALRSVIGRRAASPIAIALEKNLPVSSGIGGGSADAAATLRALARHWQAKDVDLAAVATTLGADVPMCLRSEPALATGTGEVLTPLAGLPPLHLVIVNPGVPVSTPAVFARLQTCANPPLPPLPAIGDARDLADYLQRTRNDLAGPARQIVPAIGNVLDALDATGPLMARMSGSGATCFGLYLDADSAARAAGALRKTEPAWYVRATRTGILHERQTA